MSKTDKEKRIEERFYELVVCDYREGMAERMKQGKYSSAIRRYPRKKKVNCLRCGVRFSSEGYHNKLCGACAYANSMASKIAAEVNQDVRQTNFKGMREF